MNELLLLARAPRRGAAAVLARGSLPAAIGLVLLVIGAGLAGYQQAAESCGRSERLD